MKLLLALYLVVAVVTVQTKAVSGRNGSHDAPFRKLVEVGANMPVSSAHEYIVVFDSKSVPNVTDKVVQLEPLLQQHDASVSVSHVYNAIFSGVALRHVTNATLQLLDEDPSVESIHPNIVGTMSTVQTVTNVSWGLDRIDQVHKPSDGTYTYVSAGRAVRVYVVDSGLRTTHSDFEGRAVCGFDAVNETSLPCQDLANHGTPVASIVGGKTFGVAKRVSLIGVKVASGRTNGAELKDILAGMEYVLRQRWLHPRIPMVVMMSLGFPTIPELAAEAIQDESDAGPLESNSASPSPSPITEEAYQTIYNDWSIDLKNRSSILDATTAKLIAANIAVVTSAGNVENDQGIRDACLWSPNTVPGVITVGATNVRDEVSSLSFNGPCVDIYAPGRDIASATADNDANHGFRSGTSFAAPFAAGAVARLLSYNPNLSPYQLGDALRSSAVNGTLLNIVEVPKSRSCRFTGALAKFMCPKK